MKALLIGSVLLFSLRAMSAEVGEDKKSECQFANQEKRDAKVVETKVEDNKEKSSEASAVSK